MLSRHIQQAPAGLASKRSFFGFFKAKPDANDKGDLTVPVPTEENRFYPWDLSPCADLRTRAASIRARAKCPVTSKPINYACPYSGIPTHHSREAWEKDTAYHATKKYETLRKVNVFEHDIRSGREFPEFDFPNEQDPDRRVNFINWDMFFYTRGFFSMDTEFQRATSTKMLSYPLTIGSVLNQYTPYALEPKGPVTLEGLKSLAALRYTLYPAKRQSTWKERPMRIFILGARAESQLPGPVWKQLTMLHPGVEFEIHFIGPEAYFDRAKNQYLYLNNSKTVERVDSTLSLQFHTEFFHVLHEATDFFPYDPYLDVFFCFHPGFGSPECKEMWAKSIPALLESKCAVFVSSYNDEDLATDYQHLTSTYEKDMDILFKPTENLYGATKWELNDMNPHETFQFNQQIFGFRGKRYHTVHKGDA
ncbi:hypothetical protein BABINDRAFT_106955 [Babjeviella inositovora NRRL Y-12698]|uniref:Uncharacterized protein n=1 Tax=Babjeviella inositovora NRRL Y-12698 TaxID=984486 RepID=A0A1E3QUP8_9ASCO|nr:uncharacterized protein BABINDRAFT_106955 [Babjeviella inositovora NRRL Y-12698]ODQ81409.1 hypothetical protein BABINDRAFT_106955 [Babjeviella inositovora NRRL Y-12698]